MAGRTVAGAALPFCCWIGDRLELATISLTGTGHGQPVASSSCYSQDPDAAPGVLARQAEGQVLGVVHTDRALLLGALRGVLAGRQARRQWFE